MTVDLPTEWFPVSHTAHNVTTIDGWRRFVKDRDTYRPPPLLSRADYDATPRDQRQMYDLSRNIGAANMPKYGTPMSRQVRQQVELVLKQNLYRRDPGVRPGAFVSGDGNHGKSTLMMEIAACFDDQVRAFADVFPDRFNYLDRWIPVVWLECPAKLAIGSICREFLRWCGEPSPLIGTTEPVLIGKVQTVIRDCGVQLLVVDDITRYKDGREADMDASNFLRSLMETSVTFVAMGVDIRGSGILFDGKPTERSAHLATQTGRRFSLLTLPNFSCDTDDDIRAWDNHLKAVEEDLLLLDKLPGMLSKNLSDFLFRQTNGVIGTLTDYVQSAALSIIGRPVADGGEYLTEDDFLQVALKGYDEKQAEAPPTPDKTPRRKADRPKKPPRRKPSSLYNQPSRHGVA